MVVVRYGFNPLQAIKNVKAKIAEIEKGLPTHVVIDFSRVSRDEIEDYAKQNNFDAFVGTELNHGQWDKHLRGIDRENWPAWANLSQVKVVEFYDRTGLIYETLGTLNTALMEEILVTILVIIISVWHFRSSILISGLLPLAVLMCFVAMKFFGVDANIVALSGIAIAIGTMVDMGIVLCENILKRLDEADPLENKLDVVFKASSEVGSAVLTAVSTTVVSFLPVFTMVGAEGKLFRPLAFTKTFALVASVIVALTIIPPAAHVLFGGKVQSAPLKRLAGFGLLIAGDCVDNFTVVVVGRRDHVQHGRLRFARRSDSQIYPQFHSVDCQHRCPGTGDHFVDHRMASVGAGQRCITKSGFCRGVDRWLVGVLSAFPTLHLSAAVAMVPEP